MIIGYINTHAVRYDELDETITIDGSFIKMFYIKSVKDAISAMNRNFKTFKVSKG